jgi:superfamily I DNA/RNA helicase
VVVTNAHQAKGLEWDRVVLDDPGIEMGRIAEAE